MRNRVRLRWQDSSHNEHKPEPAAAAADGSTTCMGTSTERDFPLIDSSTCSASGECARQQFSLQVILQTLARHRDELHAALSSSCSPTSALDAQAHAEARELHGELQRTQRDLCRAQEQVPSSALCSYSNSKFILLFIRHTLIVFLCEHW